LPNRRKKFSDVWCAISSSETPRVSAKTFAVVLGTEPGAAKLRKADELGIPVVDGSHFADLLETGEVPEG